MLARPLTIQRNQVTGPGIYFWLTFSCLGGYHNHYPRIFRWRFIGADGDRKSCVILLLSPSISAVPEMPENPEQKIIIIIKNEKEKNKTRAMWESCFALDSRKTDPYPRGKLIFIRWVSWRLTIIIVSLASLLPCTQGLFLVSWSIWDWFCHAVFIFLSLLFGSFTYLHFALPCLLCSLSRERFVLSSHPLSI